MAAPSTRRVTQAHWSDALARRLHLNRFALSKLAFAYLGLLPVLIIFGYLRFLPIVRTFQLSFFQSNMINPTSKFLGLANFSDLLTDKLFLLAIRNTTIFAVATVLFQRAARPRARSAAGKTLRRLGGLFEALYFLPVITPWVPVSVIWKWIYDPSYGLFNYVLSWFGTRARRLADRCQAGARLR